MTRIAFVLIYAILLSCSTESDISKTPRHTYPESVLTDFLSACASVDTAQISATSVLNNYPLLTSWKVLRFTNTDTLLHASLNQLSDSTTILFVWMHVLHTKIDSLNKLSDYKISRMFKDIPSNPNKFKEYRNRSAAELVSLWKTRYDVASDSISTHESIDEINHLQTAIKKSRPSIASNEKVTILRVSAILDLQIPSKGGMMLNKKAQIEMVRSGPLEAYGSWIVRKLEYLSD